MLAELTRAVESRHPWSRGHADRVARLADAVARVLAWGERELEAVRAGSLLHDVGKLSLPPELLAKPGPLTPLELEEMRRHPAAGARFVGSVPRARPALPCVLYHHERWDGAGYPFGLAGHDVPAEARLVALADAFDAMTSTRPYRGPLAVSAALAELAGCAGTQFDPALAQTCIDVWSAEARIAV